MNGTVLIITGSTGIGAAAARLAAAQGAKLVIATHDEVSGFDLAAQTGGSRAITGQVLTVDGGWRVTGV